MINNSPPAKKKVRKGKHRVWITKGFRNYIKTKHKLYMFLLRKPTVFNEISYKRYKNKLSQLINIAENYHYQKEFDKHKSNLRKAWHVKREIISKRTVFSYSQEFLFNGKLTQNKQLSADKFNEYFTTI